jgi:hypothetical protein
MIGKILFWMILIDIILDTQNQTIYTLELLGIILSDVKKTGQRKLSIYDFQKYFLKVFMKRH